MTKNQKNSDLNCKNKNKKIDFLLLNIGQMKKEKFQEPTNKETGLNRLEKFMTHSTFEFKTTDLLFRCHLEQRDFNSDGVKRKCFVVEIYISKGPLKDLLVRKNEDPIFSTDDAINQVNKFFENNFFSNRISPF